MHDQTEQSPKPATAQPLRLIEGLDLASLPERLDDTQLAAVRKIATAPLPSLPPCDETFLLQALRLMLAVLPRQHSDEATGELFVEAYSRQLGDQPAAAISYLVDQATRLCRWFPTIAECLEILSGWRRADADTMRRQAASGLYYREVEARREPAPPLVPVTLEEVREVKAIIGEMSDKFKADETERWEARRAERAKSYSRVKIDPQAPRTLPELLAKWDGGNDPGPD